MNLFKSISLIIFYAFVFIGCHVIMPYDYPISVIEVTAVDDGILYKLTDINGNDVVSLKRSDIPEFITSSYYIRSCSITSRQGTVIYVVTKFNDLMKSFDPDNSFNYDLNKIGQEKWGSIKIPKDIVTYVKGCLTNS